MKTELITALVPHGDGHQFVFYGNCCSGIPGEPSEKNFARVNAVLQRLTPAPDFIVFLGDHIVGPYAKTHPIQEQWSYWLNKEMSWLDTTRIPFYHCPGNHDTFDAVSEDVLRSVFPNIPRNGPPGQAGLSYWVQRGDLLLVFVNTNSPRLGGLNKWLDAVLSTHQDVPYKLVFGHHPVFPVNGYTEHPAWCVVRDEADAFWSVLVRHRVIGYLCSHIIAFDVQEHQGVIQVCSGGAGTSYGSGGFMGDGEYHHLVQAALDKDGFRLQTVDIEDNIRERFSRPIPNGKANQP
jgi:hypothetical protein